jgi:hypothetical protein
MKTTPDFMRRISSLAFGLALCGMTTVSQAQWTAFNDHVPGSSSQTHSNATTLKIPAATAPTSTNIVLKNIATGANLPATLTITRSANGTAYNLNGAAPAINTPLYNTFNGFVNFGAATDCNVELRSSQLGSITYAFTGLNPARRYSFKGGAVRGVGSQTTNWTSVQLQGALSFVDAHSARVVTKAQVSTLETNQVAVTFGQNSLASSGDQIDWENIDPGQDGAFSIVCTNYTGRTNSVNSAGGATALGYTITGIRLEEFIVGPPTIVNQPTNRIVFAGENYSFTVVASGSPPLSYQWYKNNSPIGGATSSSYTNIAAFPADNGAQFKVDVSNGSGTTPSSTVTLTVTNSKPFIIAQPQDASVTAPQTASFSANANGSKPISYQWYRNGSMISGATASNYTTAATSIADTGSKYSVMIFNSAGSTNSREATLAVSVVPVIVMPYTNMWRYDQTGRDLGTDWRLPEYVDSSWSQGRGWLAVEDNTAITPFVNTTLLLSDPVNGRVRTFYFRSHFTLNYDPNSLILVSSNYIDDGAVFYLNGHELPQRYNLAAAPAVIDYRTLSPGAATEGVAAIFTNVLPADFLVEGDNVIAVEVHQTSDTSTDVDFGMGLTAMFLPPTPLAITSNPGDRTVSQAAPTTFAVQFSGTQPKFQWYKWVNEVPVAIAGANSRLYTITNVAEADAGFYFVTVSNAISSVASASALLTVIADLSSPTLVAADGTASATNVTVSFSEFVSAATATNGANYKITNVTSGGTLTISKLVLNNGTNVILTSAARSSGVNYLLIVNNVRDISSQSNAIAPNSSIPISSKVTLVAMEQGGWDFYQPLATLNDPDPGPNWTQLQFTPPPDWVTGGQGLALFAYDPNDNEYPAMRHTQLSSGGPVAYFRLVFSATTRPSPLGYNLQLRHIVDDGIVAYLNGPEVYRYNMPEGQIKTNTPASSELGVATSVGPVDLPATASLNPGNNILAVELHGSAPNVNDPDMVFGAELQATVLSYVTGAVIVTSGPYDQIVQEGQPVTFSFQAIAATGFQWRTNGAAIPGATGPVFTIASATTNLDGKLFSVVANNSSSSATSVTARLTVLTDTIAPTLVSAYGTAPTSITASFSEPMSSVGIGTLTNYRVTNSLGANLSISGATLANGTNVVLTVSPMSSGNYTLVVNSLRDASTAANQIPSNSTATVGFQLSIPIDAIWRFYTNNTDLGNAWRATAYNDTAAPWTNGAALIADESSVLAVPIKTAISRFDNGTYHYTFYFRYHFMAPYAINNLPVTYRHVVDDGALFYLNGQQFASFNMTNDASNVTAASSANGAIEAAYSVPASTNLNIVAGENVIAVEVHQGSDGSSDIVFGAEFSGGIPSIPSSAPTAPPLQISKSQGTNVVVSWSGTGYILEKKNVLSPFTFWVPITNRAPWTYSPASSTNKATFYRLHR